MYNLIVDLVESNPANYMLSFSKDTFTFIPDAVILSNYPELADWGFAEEAHHIDQLLLGGILPLELTFENPVERELPDGAYFLRERYTLLMGVTIPGVARQMEGIAEFHLKKGQEGYWVIQKWADLRTEGKPTWSDLKAAIR